MPPPMTTTSNGSPRRASIASSREITPRKLAARPTPPNKGADRGAPAAAAVPPHAADADQRDERNAAQDVRPDGDAGVATAAGAGGIGRGRGGARWRGRGAGL